MAPVIDGTGAFTGERRDQPATDLPREHTPGPASGRTLDEQPRLVVDRPPRPLPDTRPAAHPAPDRPFRARD